MQLRRTSLAILAAGAAMIAGAIVRRSPGDEAAASAATAPERLKVRDRSPDAGPSIVAEEAARRDSGPTSGGSIEFGRVRRTSSIIEGRIADQSGAAIHEATVAVFSDVGSVVRTDREGRFALRHLGASPVTVYVAAEGYGPACVRRYSQTGVALEIRLSRAASISGRIAADPPRGGVVLKVYRYDESFGEEVMVWGARLGGAEFERGGLAPGLYALTAEAEGHEAARSPWLQIAAGQRLEGVVLSLEKRRDGSTDPPAFR